MAFVINEIVACVSTDKNGGDEGIMGWRMPDGTWMPLVASDRVRLDQIVQIAEVIKKATGCDYRVLRFGDRKDVSDEYKPKMSCDA